MVDRMLWRQRIQAAWELAPVVWLTGPRRTGKTVLAQSFPDAEFLNCDLPSVAARLEDPEAFYRSLRSGTVVFDEVHQVPDPSRILKIGADEFRRVKILATGSSTLAATRKFRDSLAGRKQVVELTPILYEEMATFGATDLDQRLLRGGLPPALLAPQHRPEYYSEWLDSYFARDVQELFGVRKRSGFLRVLELLLLQSGGLLDVTRLARDSGLSRPSVMTWLDVYQITHTIRVLRPFSGAGRREIVAQPKVFGFDTGFVCHVRGWDRLRPEDRGTLWEHLVLDSLVAAGTPRIQFWRDKAQREVDFVVPRSRDRVDAIECKWSAKAWDSRAIAAFRTLYPKGHNFIVSPTAAPRLDRTIGRLRVSFVSPIELRTALTSAPDLQ